jgi:type II secretory pathway component PulK
MRKYRQRISTLFVVIGLLCLVIGAVIDLSALTHYEFEQGRFFRLGMYFLGSGVFFLMIRFLFITLPDSIRERQSGVVTRRKALAKAYHRPKPTPGVITTSNEGSILILVLVLLGIISAISFQVIVSARSALAETSATMNMGLLRLAAIDTARSAMQALANDDDLSIDHLGEPWTDTQEYQDPSGVTRMIRITDIERTFDINNIGVSMTSSPLPPFEVLANILIFCGEFTPGEKLASLRDWIDPDTSGSRESPYYLEKNPPYRSGGRILYGWDELFLIEGWNAAMFERKPFRRADSLFESELADSVSIVPHPRDRIIPLNINTASPAVLQGIFGIGRDMVIERIITRREEEPYRSTEFLVDFLGREDYQNVLPYLDVRSHFFHIQATAFREGKTARIHVLARRSDDGRVDAIQATF